MFTTSGRDQLLLIRASFVSQEPLTVHLEDLSTGAQATLGIRVKEMTTKDLSDINGTIECDVVAHVSQVIFNNKEDLNDEEAETRDKLISAFRLACAENQIEIDGDTIIEDLIKDSALAVVSIMRIVDQKQAEIAVSCLRGCDATAALRRAFESGDDDFIEKYIANSKNDQLASNIYRKMRREYEVDETTEGPA
jgi:hypothetical protein